MRVLLDTHIWLWWLTTPTRLNPHALDLLSNQDTSVYLSAASSWEIAIKVALGKLQLPVSPEEFVPTRLARDGFLSLPIEHAHALRVARLPPHHRDPFDRLLIAQAQVETLPLLTHDPQLALYDVSLIQAGQPSTN